MKFFTSKPKFSSKEEKKSVESKVTTMDKVILQRCKSGADIGSIMNVCRPYKNKYSLKVFASFSDIRRAVSKLEGIGYLIRR